MNGFRVSLLSAFFATACSACCLGQTLGGSVQNLEGRPIGGVRVQGTLSSSGGAKTALDATSSPDGRWSVKAPDGFADAEFRVQEPFWASFLLSPLGDSFGLKLLKEGRHRIVMDNAGLKIHVSLPDSSPAAGAKALIDWRGADGSIASDSRGDAIMPLFRLEQKASRYVVPGECKFTFLLLLGAKAGYAILSTDRMKNDDEIVLKPWRKISGSWIGKGILPGRIELRSYFKSLETNGRQSLPCTFANFSSVDENGYFEFEHVPDAPFMISFTSGSRWQDLSYCLWGAFDGKDISGLEVGKGLSLREFKAISPEGSGMHRRSACQAACEVGRL